MSDPLGIMPPHDPVNDAMVSAEKKAVQVKMLQLGATLPTGRPVRILVPVDISSLEALVFIGWAGDELAKRIASRPSARILVPK